MSAHLYEPRVYLIHCDDGIVRDYDTLDAAAIELHPLINDWRRPLSLGEYHDTYPFGYLHSYAALQGKLAHADYILRDNHGRHLRADDIIAAWDRLHPRPLWRGRRRRHYSVHVYEGGKDYRRCPVPHSGHCSFGRRWHSTRGAGFGPMRERREIAAFFSDPDLIPWKHLVRARRRNAVKSITGWDGPSREWGHRSWKNYRRDRWKPITA